MDIEKQFERWTARADSSLQPELNAMAGDPDKKRDAFYRTLEFGTGGLRGVIGAGTNRMNIHVVAHASQGLADYVNAHFTGKMRSVAVSYDSRNLSDVFARIASSVFAANGLQVYLYPELMPTPCLSYAVRAYGAGAGVMVTASHNPARYNGYKVYGPDGCQITTQAAGDILAAIDALDMFDDVKAADFDSCVRDGRISYIGDDVVSAFIGEIMGLTMLSPDTPVDRNVSIVYTPLNGTGLKPVTRVLRESGFTSITVVPEQEKPDGDFPTCPYPNPEIREAMELGIRLARKKEADLLIATDPDCDRCGIAVRGEGDDYVLLTGNETGMLLFDYILTRREAMGKMPKAPTLVKTIVTTDMADRIAQKHGVRVVDVLTGFKFIGEVIGRLESEGHKDDYIFGFEESYGYLSGTHVRDKDAVNAAFLIAEMFAYHRARGVSLLDRLNELYAEFGYQLNTLHSFTFEGQTGFEKMQDIMAKIRRTGDDLAGYPVSLMQDYKNGLDGLPKSDVLRFRLKNGAGLVIRPSGTEPKLKIYLSVVAKDRQEAEKEEQRLIAAVESLLD